MDKLAALRMAEVQECAAQDGEYQKLLAEYRLVSPVFLGVLESLPREDASVIEEYLGLTAQMHRKLLELACTE